MFLNPHDDDDDDGDEFAHRHKDGCEMCQVVGPDPVVVRGC